jgi:lipopolysaccharide export LptBFGC system permease protein LptF
MAASGRGDRRGALWPYLVMPIAVLLVYYTLTQLHRQAGADAAVSPAGTDVRP